MKETDTYNIYNNAEFVERYAKDIKNIYNKAFYDRTAIIKLLANIKNKDILDAGCGPGVYLEWMLAEGANPTGLDYSAEMLKHVQEKLGNKVKLFRGDLTEKLDFLPDKNFDIILCTMVLLHIKDWTNTFLEFNRILKDDGELVFSTVHPFADISDDNDYFKIQQVEEDWDSYNISMPSYKRPLESIFKTVKDSGFIIEELVEPSSDDEEINQCPWFICFKLKKSR